MLLEENSLRIYYQCIKKTNNSENRPYQKGELLDGLKAFDAVGLQNIFQAQLAIRGV